ncbi:hypothetical protein A0O34_11470 [Chryseobacterium glaciei]|uniref:Uncharacterized protein n=1 Tax=Chryseobacterium glaciei TaxID=1685010 RepID=A0A172XVV9_9FLAO|nr:hypothetical protein [Chryseobacterium glaciei]ANF51094.1 hypothetical protein A0O34_11470 [Chryseobacterium glaciei]
MRQKNNSKRFLLLIMFFGFWSLFSAQEKTIIKILNRELKKEVKNQLKYSNFNGDTISIVKEFSIDNNKNLTFQIKKTSPYFSGYQIIKQEVPLNKILKIGKDIQVILETEKDAVVTTTTTFDDTQKEQKFTESLFFLYISNEKQNEDLGIEIQKAFQKAGFKVKKEYWYD